MKSGTLQKELEDEFQQLKEDRTALRSIFPTGNSKVSVRHEVLYVESTGDWFRLHCQLILQD